ncbi:MAG: hypothetical protein OEX08_01770 [Candidatus Nomurabacteria bacterium]|nr:hypothetical protein [Candidatus Nomurabacteria bacterium]
MNNKKVMMGVVVVVIVILAFVFVGLLNHPEIQNETTQTTELAELNDQNTKMVAMQNGAIIYVPDEWLVASEVTLNPGCIGGYVVNQPSDGHRQSGEIAVYPEDCYNPNIFRGVAQMETKKGFIVMAFFDGDATDNEVIEVRQAFNYILSTIGTQ